MEPVKQNKLEPQDNKLNITKDVQDLITEIFGSGPVVSKTNNTNSTADIEDEIGKVFDIDVRSSFNETEQTPSTTLGLNSIYDNEEITDNYKHV